MDYENAIEIIIAHLAQSDPSKENSNIRSILNAKGIKFTDDDIRFIFRDLALHPSVEIRDEPFGMRYNNDLLFKDYSSSTDRRNYSGGKITKNLPRQRNDLKELMNEIQHPDRLVEENAAGKEVDRLPWDADLRKIKGLLAEKFFEYDSIISHARSFNVPVEKISWSKNAANDWIEIFNYFMITYPKIEAKAKILEMIREIVDELPRNSEFWNHVERFENKM